MVQAAYCLMTEGDDWKRLNEMIITAHEKEKRKVEPVAAAGNASYRLSIIFVRGLFLLLSKKVQEPL